MSNHILTQDGKWVTISDDELYHWKYIKREKVNGKWRYIYKDTKVDKTKARQDEAKKNFDRELDEEHMTSMSTRLYTKQYASSIEDYKTADRLRAEARSQANAAGNEWLRAKEKYETAKKKYEKSAGHKVADLLNKSSDAVDKAKSWVSGLFSKKKNK